MELISDKYSWYHMVAIPLVGNVVMIGICVYFIFDIHPQWQLQLLLTGFAVFIQLAFTLGYFFHLRYYYQKVNLTDDGLILESSRRKYHLSFSDINSIDVEMDQFAHESAILNCKWDSVCGKKIKFKLEKRSGFSKGEHPTVIKLLDRIKQN